ncbi:MAG: AAA family ATPase [Thermoguttaceae bacterium]
MYESYWRLKQKPFENAADPRFYYPGQSHQAALLKLRYAVENRRGAALLAGPSGAGKTLLTVMLQKALDDRFSPFVHLVFPQMSTGELLGYLADELDGGRPAGQGGLPPQLSAEGGVQHAVRRIERFLTANVEKGRHAVVAVDEAQLIRSPETFEALRLLLNFEPGGTPALTLLLVGQPSILPTINRMPQWEERLAVKCLLRPFAQPETESYVEHRLRAAGSPRPIIEPDAVPTLQELTHGIARQINRLCDLALLIGYAEEQQTLGAGHFEAVCRELVTVAPD